MVCQKAGVNSSMSDTRVLGWECASVVVNREASATITTAIWSGVGLAVISSTHIG